MEVRGGDPWPPPHLPPGIREGLEVTGGDGQGLGWWPVLKDGDGEERLRSGRVRRRCPLRSQRPGRRGQVAGEETRRGSRAAPPGRAEGRGDRPGQEVRSAG